MRLAFELKEGAASAREKWGTTRPRVCQQEGSPIYLLKEEKWSAAREKRKEKRRRKRRTIRKGGGGVSQSVGREEDASERDAREETHLKLWREKGWGGVVPQKKGEGRGNCGVAGERLGEFPRDRDTSQPWEFTQTVPHIHVTPLHQVHFCPPSSDAGAFFLSFR